MWVGCAFKIYPKQNLGIGFSHLLTWISWNKHHISVEAKQRHLTTLKSSPATGYARTSQFPPTWALTWKSNSLNAWQKKKLVTKQNRGYIVACARVRSMHFWTSDKMQFMLWHLICYRLLPDYLFVIVWSVTQTVRWRKVQYLEAERRHTYRFIINWFPSHVFMERGGQ